MAVLGHVTCRVRSILESCMPGLHCPPPLISTTPHFSSPGIPCHASLLHSPFVDCIDIPTRSFFPVSHNVLHFLNPYKVYSDHSHHHHHHHQVIIVIDIVSSIGLFPAEDYGALATGEPDRHTWDPHHHHHHHRHLHRHRHHRRRRRRSLMWLAMFQFVINASDTSEFII